MKKLSIVWAFLGIAVAVLFLSVFLSYRSFKILTTLGTGWFSFLQRTAPKLTWNWDLIGMAILSGAIILFIAHKLLSGLAKNIAAAQGTQWHWPWKWTWSSLLALLLLFVVGMAVGGTVHQIGWLVSSPESLFESKAFRATDMNNMKQIELAYRIAFDDENGNLGRVRAKLWDPKSEFFDNRKNLQTYQMLIVVDQERVPQGIIVFPRDPKRREQIGGLYLFNDDGSSIPSKELAELIKKHRANLVAF